MSLFIRTRSERIEQKVTKQAKKSGDGGFRLRNRVMRRMIANPTPCGVARREFLWQTGGAFSSLALVDLLGANGFFQHSLQGAEPTTHFPTKAKHCIFLFMN